MKKIIAGVFASALMLGSAAVPLTVQAQEIIGRHVQVVDRADTVAGYLLIVQTNAGEIQRLMLDNREILRVAQNEEVHVKHLITTNGGKAAIILLEYNNCVNGCRSHYQLVDFSRQPVYFSPVIEARNMPTIGSQNAAIALRFDNGETWVYRNGSLDRAALNQPGLPVVQRIQ